MFKLLRDKFFKKPELTAIEPKAQDSRAVPESIMRIVHEAPSHSVSYPDIPASPGMSDPGIASLALPNKRGELVLKKFELPEVPKGVLPEGVKAGMDAAGTSFPNIDIMSQMDGLSALSFPGWTYLAQLAQIPEYNLICTVFADELIGSWINVAPSSKGERSDTREAIEDLRADLEKFKVKQHLYHMVYMDGAFGKGTIHPAIESSQIPLEDLRELPLVISPQTVKKGTLKYFKTVEPYWLSPQALNTTDPLKEDFFEPSFWYVMGKKVHGSRLKSLVTNPVPDLLKPYYIYGGLSKIQVCMPGTNRAIKTLNSVTAMVDKYSIVALKTDLGGLLQNSQAMTRIQWFNKVRNNLNMLLIDSSNDEELIMANATLAGLKELAEQAVKFMAMYAKIPNSKLLQDEVETNPLSGSKKAPQMSEWEQYVQIQRKTHLTPILKWMIDLIMLNRWGEIRDDIEVKWNPVHELDAEGRASLSLIKAQVAQLYKSNDVVSADEIRERISKDPDSEFSGLTGKAPPPQDEGNKAGQEGKGDGSEHKTVRPEIREGGKVTISRRI